MPQHPLPEAFTKKKIKILQLLSLPSDTYTDRSPKGSVDVPIIDLIKAINEIDGLVTTSSCSGRVAVFVEGQKADNGFSGLENEFDDQSPEDGKPSVEHVQGAKKGTKLKSGPGGKGGGKWLFVSHEPVPIPRQRGVEAERGYFTTLCGLQRPQEEHTTTVSCMQDSDAVESIPRLIRLSFSPLILHILTADLALHARPLLSAAINAGFRESGVQSLAALDSSEQVVSTSVGTMLAIRTAGLSFETVVGRVRTIKDKDGDPVDIMEALVSEEYLKLCFGVIHERFQWNEVRKERLIFEIRSQFEKTNVEIKPKEERRRRKRAEGLKVQKEREMASRQHDNKKTTSSASSDDFTIETLNLADSALNL